ncbi:putative 2-hydroxy-3-oxopropionate reductase [alpha proteobacterium BAL199]|jgi:3-hydroxyisobutyrate dehydrogenase-like beta-hydroxyacid dehydrogenase|nr:putative 2-hydroxy-3-oxopropionate reductase [alpha proteobacterium BAL199]
MPSPRVAFLGIGLMGASMASNIARADLPITVWNRTPEKARQLTEAGVLVANTAAEAVADADVVCTIVTNAEAVEGCCHVNSSS